MFLCTNNILWALVKFQKLVRSNIFCSCLLKYAHLYYNNILRAIGEILDFSSIEHYFVRNCTKICSFVLRVNNNIYGHYEQLVKFRFYVRLNFLLFICTKICSFVLTSILLTLLALFQLNIFCSFPHTICSMEQSINRIPLEVKKIVLHLLKKPSTWILVGLIEQLIVQSHYSANELQFE